MFTQLRNTFSQVLNRLQTHVILMVYEKSNFVTQAKLYHRDVKRIAENRYDMEAYFRLSIMHPQKKKHCAHFLKACGLSPEKIKARLSELQNRFSHAALLTPKGIHS